MVEWYKTLTVLDQVYFWIGIVSTVFLILQIILMSFSAFGGDLDIDGDGDIDVDFDSGVSLFTMKGMTAFFAVGSWAGLLTSSLVSDGVQWVSVIVAVVCGGLAMTGVAFLLKGISKLQCNGAIQTEQLVGKRATVYVSVPAARSGRGKVTLTAQGRYLELDAVTDGEERIATDEVVEIVSTENECTVVKRVEKEQTEEGGDR